MLKNIVFRFYIFLKENIKKAKIFTIKLEQYFRRKSIKNPIYLPSDLSEIDAKVVLYLTGNESSAYQGNMWLDVLEKINIKTVVVVRDYNILYGLSKTKLPIVYIELFNDLELLENIGVKTVLYPANGSKNTQPLRLYRLNHYFINHGESDKVVNQSKLLMAYDKLLLSGEIAYKRLLEAKLPLRENQITFVGRPQVELFLKIKNIGKIKTILYAPTWEGFVEEANYTSINEYGLKLINQLKKLSEKGYVVYFKPHPFTARTKRNNIDLYYKNILKIVKNSNISLVNEKCSIYDYMNECDLMITDVSSIISDFLYTQKPMILTNSRKNEQYEINKNFYSTKALYILDEPFLLQELIYSIDKNDFLKNTRVDTKNKILGEISEGYLKKFTEVLYESIN